MDKDVKQNLKAAKQDVKKLKRMIVMLEQRLNSEDEVIVYQAILHVYAMTRLITKIDIDSIIEQAIKAAEEKEQNES